MKIRRARVSDYKELMELYNGFVGEERYLRHDNDSFHKVIKNPNNFIFVAEDAGKLVGFAAFSIRDVVRYPKPIAELDEIFVAQDYRQKGVGRKLMQAVEQKAKDLNCYRIYIETHHTHKTAHIFYEALRYTNYGYHFIKNLSS